MRTEADETDESRRVSTNASWHPIDLSQLQYHVLAHGRVRLSPVHSNDVAWGAVQHHTTTTSIAFSCE